MIHWFLFFFKSSLLLIHAPDINGVSTQVMTMLTALLILSKILHIRYCYILWVSVITFLASLYKTYTYELLCCLLKNI